MIELIGFIIWFALANAFAGGKFHLQKKQGGPLPGRGIYYSGLATIVLGAWLYSWLGALVGISFLIWRIPSWYGATDMGTLPTTKGHFWQDWLIFFARAFVAFPVFLWEGFTGLMDWGTLAVIALLAALLQPLSYVAGNYSPWTKGNGLLVGWTNELLSGASWGLVFWLMVFT